MHDGDIIISARRVATVHVRGATVGEPPGPLEPLGAVSRPSILVNVLRREILTTMSLKYVSCSRYITLLTLVITLL